MKYWYIKTIQFFRKRIWRYAFGDERYRRSRKMSLLKTVLLAVREFLKKDMMARDVPALTYSTLMALIPLMALMFVIARGFGCDVVLEEWINRTLEAQPTVAEYLVNFVKNYLANTKSQYIIGAGVVMMMYTLYSLMQKIERTFDSIWHAQQRKWSRMLTDYTAILFVFALMILLASGVNLVAGAVTKSLADYTGLRITASVLLHLVAVIPLIIFFIFVYTYIPNTYIKVRCTIGPSVISGVSMFILQDFYISIQVWLSSYNVIYGSLAALPLFLMWLQLSWTICMFGAVLCYSNQNLHHFDYDSDYQRLRREKKIKVCAIVMHHVCRLFKDGGQACTASDIHSDTMIPQQIVNGAVKNLLDAHLIVEIKSGEKGMMEEQSRLHPAEDTANLTYGLLVERLDMKGDDLLEIDINSGRTEEWERANALRERYIMDARNIPLSDI